MAGTERASRSAPYTHAPFRSPHPVALCMKDVFQRALSRILVSFLVGLLSWGECRLSRFRARAACGQGRGDGDQEQRGSHANMHIRARSVCKESLRFERAGKSQSKEANTGAPDAVAEVFQRQAGLGAMDEFSVTITNPSKVSLRQRSRSRRSHSQFGKRDQLRGPKPR
jgi:hypothetical protein